MDPDDLRSVLKNSGTDLWTLIDSAISFAASEHSIELKIRRDGIVEKLYSMADSRCHNCESKISVICSKEQEDEEDEEEEESDYRTIDEEQSKILAIKDFLDDPDQSEDSLVSLLQNLADMDITFKALKETDIGRHVNGLRKHSSIDVKRLVKQLVRKWKETVDDWVKLNSANGSSSPAIITDGDSPQQIPVKNNQNGFHQTPDYSPNPPAQNGNWQVERNSLESVEPKLKPAPRREATPKSFKSASPSASIKVKEKESLLDPDRLASARKRLHENYQEVQNARKQRTIQVMDIHEIPKPKNTFFARNKGGFQAKH